MNLKATAMDTVQWLRQANAKAVFSCLVVSFLCASGLWAFNLMSEIKNPALAPSSRNRSKDKAPLGVVALADSIDKIIADNFPSVSPFAGAPAVAKRDRRNRRHRKPASLSIADRIKMRDKPARLPRPPKKETISLVYKGIFKRTDGVKMALIKDSRSDQSTFYLQDRELFGMTLKNIKPESIEIKQQDGESVKLEIDESAVFVEGTYAP